MTTTADIIIPEVHSWTQIVERAKERTATSKPTVALVCLDDHATVAAYGRAFHEGLIKPRVFAPDEDVTGTAKDLKAELSADVVESVSCGKYEDILKRIMADDDLDAVVYGGEHPGEFMDALLLEETGFTDKRAVVSHVGIMQPERYPKLLFITDALFNPNPDLVTKLGLIANLITVAEAVGIENPRTAVLAAVEVVYPQMPVTQEGAVLAKMAERHQIKGALVDGPLSFDVAIDRIAAEAKGVTTSEVAGQADALLAPTVEAAQGIYQGVAMYAHAQVGGVVMGGRRPVVLPMTVEDDESRFHSIVLAALMS